MQVSGKLKKKNERMTEYLFKSEKRLPYRIIYIGGIIFTLFFSVYFFSINNRTYSIQKLETIFPAFLFLLSLIILFVFVSIPDMYFTNSGVELRSIFGFKKSTIKFDEIESWVTRERKSKYEKWETLTIITKENKSIKISGYHFSNYYEIKDLLIRGKRKNLELEKRLKTTEKFNFAIGSFIVAIIFLFIAFQFSKDPTLTESEVKKINGILSDNIYVEQDKKIKTLVVKLENISNLKFIVNSISFDQTKTDDLINEAKKGDSITLTIRKADFIKKISKKENLNFFEKLWSAGKIEIVQIEKGNIEYLSLKDCNRKNKENSNSSFWLFSILSGILIIVGVKSYTNKNKRASH